MDKNPTVFISYSWENDEQKEWVISLVNLLRENGVVATSDVFEIQQGTVNFNTLMVEKIRDSDYTIIVLTEKYAKKADLLQGGVGFETGLLLSYLQENVQKIVPIMNAKWNATKIVPFYLKGVYYIDFSEQRYFKEKFKELLHRIYRVDLVEKVPLGARPILTPQKAGVVDYKMLNDIGDLIPDFREITDIDKNEFIRDSFITIKAGLLQLLETTKNQNRNFDFDLEDITHKKTIYKLYVNGNQKLAFKIWLDNNFGSVLENINIAYGKHIFSTGDNSINEIISCEVGKDKNLYLKMTMNMFGDKNANTPVLVVKELWKNSLMWLN